MIRSEVICDYAAPAVRLLPERLCNLIMTSPPYNIGKSYETSVAFDKYLNSQEEVIRELMRVMTDDGSLCWQVGNYVYKGEIFPLDAYFYEIFTRYGLILRKRIIWHFGHGLHCKKRFSGRYETILWFTKSDKFTFEIDKHVPEDIQKIVVRDWKNELWNIANVKSNHPEKTTKHPCQFPVELVERCILMLTKPGDMVLDPYSGVGTTMVAAWKNGRHSIGIDKERQNCDDAIFRLNELRAGRLKTRPINKAIHIPPPKKASA